MTAYTQHVAATNCRARAATYTRVGSHDAAARMIARAEQYEAMTDSEFEADQARFNRPAVQAAARRMADEIISKTR